jgi:hypothetical protein
MEKDLVLEALNLSPQILNSYNTTQNFILCPKRAANYNNY